MPDPQVNNTRYVRWALNAMARVEPTLPPIQSLHITYLAEAFEKDELTITLAPSPPTNGQASSIEHPVSSIEGRILAAHRSTDHTPIFAMRLTYH